MIQKPFQRVGAESNSQVGRDFEVVAQRFFASRGVSLQIGHAVDVGIGSVKKRHSFDLGCAEQKWLVECKCHRWTAGHNIPTAEEEVVLLLMYAKAKTDNITGPKLKEIRRVIEN